eukprot:1159305-Pelagomonas_calceolata.AAC.1
MQRPAATLRNLDRTKGSCRCTSASKQASMLACMERSQQHAQVAAQHHPKPYDSLLLSTQPKYLPA